MCGFVGMVGLNGANADATAVGRMSAVLHHRGPDDDGAFMSGPVALAFRRLSILDLSPTGNQPMISPDGKTILVFNGEIYNYVELRRELQGLGHRFESSGDTEVLLHAYLEWGNECLSKLNGMWAFLIYNRERGTIFGSRDRFGKKPLYRYRCGEYIFFASEIKGILASGYYRSGPNWKIIADFVYNGALEGNNETFYSEIEKVPAGSAFECDLQGKCKEWRFWSLTDLPNVDLTRPAESFYEIFKDSLRLRLRSDVPVGIFLSGGLDSTAMICTLAQMNGEGNGKSTNRFWAFSYQAEEYDESVYINDTVKQTGAHLIPYRPDPNTLWDTIGRFLWYQDEPVQSMAAVITFELSRLAAESGVKVILIGWGPDEYLAGYHSFFVAYWQTILGTSGARGAWKEICAYCLAHGGDPWTLFAKCLGRKWRSKAGWIPGLRRPAHWQGRRAEQMNRWFAPELARYLEMNTREYVEPTLVSVLTESVERSPLPLYLRMEDRNSMAHSIETRMPFLDYRLVSLAFQLPANWKMRGPWNKYVLREAMRGRVPESVQARLDKMGLPVPMKRWFAQHLYEPMQDLLGSRDVQEQGLYNVGAIRRDLELHRQGEVNVSGDLFKVAQLIMWRKLEKENKGSYRETRSVSEGSQGIGMRSHQ